MDLASILLQLLASVIAIIVAARTLRMHLPGASGALKERLPSFDFLKGACIIMVVMTHARALSMPPSFLAGPLALAVPSFLFASGYLTAKRNPDGVPNDYYWGAWWRIGLVYVIFTLGWMILAGEPLQSVPFFLALGLANDGSLYFMPVLLGLYLAYPVLLRLQSMLGWANLLLLSLCFSAAWQYVNLEYNSAVWNANPVSTAFFGRFLFVFTAGMCLSRMDYGRLVGWTRAALALFILISWAALSRLAPMPILYLFVPVAFSCILLNVHWIAMKLAPVLAKPFEALGRNTLAIYMVHWPLLLFALEPLIPGDVPAEMSFVILAVLAVIISYSFSLVFIPAYRSILARLGVYGGSGAI